MSFVHLHVHTHYSMLDGACRIPDLVKRCKSLGMNSMAISDHGSMYGAIEFYNTCKANDIKPIIGIEAYMAPGDRRERSSPTGNPGDAAFHLLLLAENREGYHNLLKLTSLSYREGFYYKPRIDKETLKQYSKGLIATSACLGGEVASAFMKRNMAEAKRVAETYMEIFGPDRFYIEVQKHIPEQDQVNPELAELAKKLGVGLVGTNDVHFLTAEDHHAHDCLCCISTGRLITDENRMKYPTQLYLKSPEEMSQALKGFPDAMENTVRIANMCNLDLDFSKRYAPVYRVPEEKLDKQLALPSCPAPIESLKDDEKYLRQLCEEGLEWRYGTRDVSKEIRDRMEYELRVICMKQFCSYFLIVWDFCNYARDNGIPVGARGSGVGTMVGYLLGLCNVDPIKYSLLFERFMDPSRNEMPDIDIDICQDGRQKVIEYVRNKYGHVAQIITFGTLAAKAACKDVGRVMGVPLPEIDALTKLIPATPGMTIDKAIAQVPDLKHMIDQKPQIKQVIDVAKKLEGLCRNAGVHAAGVIIADQPLDDVIPLCRDKEENVLTQYEGPIAEKCGMLKMDFLGLRTLSVLTRSIDLVKQTKGIEIDIEKIDITDRKVLDLFCRGETKGVFQFESGGMQDLLMKMRPDRLEDLIAANALYRPGPMELIPLYCGRKHGTEAVPNVHPIMDRVLEETYGIMCIHEDTRIALADGSEKPIRDVRAGDVVHSLNPATNRFEAKECHGCGPTRFGEGVRLTLENGYSVTLTPDHKVLTYDGYKEAGELRVDEDIVAVAVDVPQEKPTVRNLAPWLGDDESVAYLIGTLLGDGCLTASGCTIATGRESDHRVLCRWLKETMPSLRQHEYFHGRCWYLSLSDPALLNDPAHGNRKTRFHHFLDSLGIKCRAREKRVPEMLFRTRGSVRASLLAGLLDSDGCCAVTKKGVGVCFVSSVSPMLLQDLRRLSQLEGVASTIRKSRIQFWNLERLKTLVEDHCLVRRFEGKLGTGKTIGWVPRGVVAEIARSEESLRAFFRRTGLQRNVITHDLPFVKTDTAARCGIDLGGVRYHRVAKIERVADQQFYGMSVEHHHNLLANGVVIKNCYQEQVMQIFNQLGGIELSNSYKLIKAISKKTTDVIAKFKPDFIKGTMEKGVSEDKAKEIFDLILKFGGYGFNKSHSTRYAFVAFQTAYMKTYHPVEYMAALLTYEMGSTDKIVEYIDEARRMKINVLPPDVNISDKVFTPVYAKKSDGGKQKSNKSDPSSLRRSVASSLSSEHTIRFGLCAVRGVGEKAVENIIDDREKNGEYKNIYDFCERIDTRAVQKSTVDALIRCGAFASMKAARAQLLNVLEPAFEAGQRQQDDKRSGQIALFGAPEESSTTSSASNVVLPNIDEFEPAELLKMEKELLGFYITSHPLAQQQKWLDKYTTASTREAMNCSEGTEVTIGAMLSAVKTKVAKTGRSAGQRWAILEIEDLDGKIEGMLFAEGFASISAKFPDLLKAESICFVKGKIDRKRENPCLIVNDVIPVTEAISRLTTAVLIKFDPTQHTHDTLAAVKPVLGQFKGNTDVYAQLLDHESRKVTLKLAGEYKIKPGVDLIENLEQLLGNGNVDVVGEGLKRIRRLEQQKLFNEQPAEDTKMASEDAVVAEMDAAMD